MNLKDADYKIKFNLLSSWMGLIVDRIKKELKQDHLLSDRSFVKLYLSGKHAARATSDELARAYSQAIEEGREDIGDLICTRWILKNGDIYQFFAENLEKINPKFDQIEELPQTEAEKLLDEAYAKFEPTAVYIFTVLNSVVFPKPLLEKMRIEAENTSKREEAALHSKLEEAGREELIQKHSQEILRIIDKYEKKLSGMQKKYFNDVEGLKKQIADLHRKLAART